MKVATVQLRGLPSYTGALQLRSDYFTVYILFIYLYMSIYSKHFIYIMSK